MTGEAQGVLTGALGLALSLILIGVAEHRRRRLAPGAVLADLSGGKSVAEWTVEASVPPAALAAVKTLVKKDRRRPPFNTSGKRCEICNAASGSRHSEACAF